MVNHGVIHWLDCAPIRRFENFLDELFGLGRKWDVLDWNIVATVVTTQQIRRNLDGGDRLDVKLHELVCAFWLTLNCF
jgi:hypothetical protein